MPAQIMAIINTSPDSFNGDGIAARDEMALQQRIVRAVEEGADILDIGGQSTRPGAEIITIEEELERTIGAIGLARRLCDLPISIDTFKPEVAQEALRAGATIVNDIHGCQSHHMRSVVAASTADVVIMHSRGNTKTMTSLTQYPAGVVTEAKQRLLVQAEQLEAMGVAKERIIIDPGIGFAKTAPQSFELTRCLETFKDLGYRVLYGASQKSFLGKALAKEDVIAPAEQRTTATTVVQAYAMLHGADIVRVHDVRQAVETRIIVQAIMGKVEVME